MEAMTQRDAGPIDCNRNGINDSIDIAHGYDDDLNRNGKIDFCDPDARVREMSRSDQSWRQSRAGEKQSYFSVRMRDSRSPGGDIDVALVRYTLPVEALVTLSVRNVDESRVDTDLVNRRRQTGPIEMKWTQKLRGKYVPGGIYEIALRVGPRVYKRRLAWAG